jgi:hypothetical protein
MNFILNTIPKKAVPQIMPAKSDQLAYGAYMANASGCNECHTKANNGRIIESLEFSGGREFFMPDKSIIRSANITPAEKTGIGKWTEDIFIGRFKMYADSTYHPPTVPTGQFQSIMPWTMYGKMDHDDLAAIYKYLQTVKPIENSVVKFTPPNK